MGEYDIAKAFDAIERELMTSMIRNLDRHKAEENELGIEWSQWQAEQLKRLEQYKIRNRKKYGSQFADINRQIDGLIRTARESGGMEQEIEILKAIRNGFRGAKKSGDTLTAQFFRTNDRRIEGLIKATTDDMKKAETAILRMADDKYRQILFNAQVYANTGAGTYEKAVDMATKDMLSAGLNCVEYANGARHTLADYADMAIRTACKRAYLTGEGEKRKEWGISTVIMNKRGNPCPRCLPWVGKIMIDDVWSGGKKSDGNYPLMSTAVAAGLYHPRCKDGHTTYFEGISTPPDSKFTRREIQDIEQQNKEAEEQQYARRQQEKYQRLAENSLDNENKRIYRQREETWNNVASSYKYPIDEEMFTSFVRSRDDRKNTDIIRPHNIIKALKKNKVGRDAYDYIRQQNIPIYMMYNVDNPMDLFGEYDPIDRSILIYADKTKSIHESVKTVIHEAAHDRLGHKGTRKEEILCFLEEMKYDGIELTPNLMRDIIRAVNKNEIYKDLPWR